MSLTLKDYMLYTDRVRTYSRKKMSLTEAVDRAVDECISEGILAEFLRKNRAVVKNMSIYEYDEELHMKTTREEGYEDGYNSGIETGIQGAITALRSLDTPDNIIIEKIVTVYQISEDEARNYMNNK